MKTVLQIIRTKENLKDKNSTYYMNSIIREANVQGVDVEIYVANSQQQFTDYIAKEIPTLVLEPCEFKGEPKYNAETNQTALVSALFVKGFAPAPAKVLIINRSQLIGRPLANMLLDNDYTVTVAHSKTEDLYALALDYNVIVTATGTKMDFNIPLTDKYIVDVSDDFDRGYCEKHCKGYVGMREVGKATVYQLIKDAEALKNKLECHAYINEL